jgi:predicted HTH domain antitoxin
MTIDIPDDILKRAGLTERDVLIELACRLFDADRLGKGEASYLCGLGTTEFENELYRRGLARFHATLEDYEMDIGEQPGKKAG